MSIKQNYKNLREGYAPLVEDFFMRYALNGNMINKDIGTRAGMPGLGPRFNSPVLEPSPLESQFVYDYALYGPQGALRYANKPIPPNLTEKNIINQKPNIPIKPINPSEYNYYIPDNNFVDWNINPWFDYYHARGPTVGVYGDN